MLTTLLLVAALSGCGDDADVPAGPTNERRSKKKEKGDGDKPKKKKKADGDAKAARVEDGKVVVPDGDVPDVVLVVLDTVRADHTSLCGYDRPTTPVLERLVAKGAKHSCEGVAPASWTLPSHATFFTGVLLPEHHYDSLKTPDWSAMPTLAERLAAKGYSTVLVTANPVLTKARGLAKGFDVVASAEEIGSWRGPEVTDHLRKALGKVDPKKPMFLVVNVMDAHDPYPAVPAGQGWVPERPRLDFHVKDRDHAHPYHQFLKDELAPADRDAFLAAVRDGYDWGVSQADTSLRSVLGELERRGRVQHGVRLVVTSDHGEFLGEHGLLRHGGWLWEPAVRVPLLVHDTRPGAKTPDLPKGPLSTAVVFDLLLDGALPATPRPAVAFESRSNFAENPGANQVALWTDTSKLVWSDDRVVRYDLAADPGEATPAKQAGQGPLAPWVKAYRAQVAWREAQPASPEDLAALRALGYVEKGSE